MQRHQPTSGFGVVVLEMFLRCFALDDPFWQAPSAIYLHRPNSLWFLMRREELAVSIDLTISIEASAAGKAYTNESLAIVHGI